MMFGLIVSGRLPIYNFQQVSENQFLIQLADIENSGNHLVVYMTGEMPFPDGYAGAVYFNYQVETTNEFRWIYLGKLCNEKPSSIFKITSLKHDPTNSGVSLLPFGSLAPHHVSTAMVGISVEPVAQIDALVPAQDAQPSNNINSFVDFSQKMLENFYNYAASFSKSAPDGISYVPLNTLQNWFENFKRRLMINPNFWKN